MLFSSLFFFLVRYVCVCSGAFSDLVIPLSLVSSRELVQIVCHGLSFFSFRIRHINAMWKLSVYNQLLLLHGQILLVFSWKLAILTGLCTITRYTVHVSFLFILSRNMKWLFDYFFYSEFILFSACI